jgi:lactoylglutathione lyase
MGQVIGQFCINVTDIELSIEFWRDVLGIPLQSRTEIPQAHEAVLQAHEGGSRIQLAQQLDQDGPIEMGGAMWKLYVYSDDCAALYQRCLDAGCEPVMEPMALERWPVTVAFIKDRDGYLIELIENHVGTPAGMPDPGSVTANRPKPT